MLNTATSYLALLQEDDSDIKSISLDKLNLLVDDYWAEISDYIKELEDLYNSGKLPDRQELISLILSKIYYNLEDYDSAIEWALEANNKFNITEKSQFVSTILKKMIEKYISIRKNNFFSNESLKIDNRIINIVERIFNKSLQNGAINQAIGFSLESYDLDKLTQAVESSGNIKEKLKYLYEISQDLIVNNEYRNAVLNIILRLYAKHANNQYIDITNCQFLLNNSDALSSTLINILKNENEPLIAYQVAFDLFDNENAAYLKTICNLVRTIGEEQNIDRTKLQMLISILEGNIQRDILEYSLCTLNKSDPMVMKNLVKSVEKAGSVAHLGVIIANSLFNSHTKNDNFLKENIEWCAKATNWSRFIATSSLGAIHMGNTSKGLEIMKQYMPGSSSVPSIYAQAGSYYGLGLIYANTNDEKIVKLLREALDSGVSSKETMQHGIYLALGLVAMSTHNQDLYERIRDGLYLDDAIVGEAAGISIGLIMLGSQNPQAIEDLVTYSHDTQHEKIIRAIAIGLALIMYGAEESADPLIEQLSREKDPILRYGAMFTIGLAYAGTGSTTALKKLIKFSVSDVNDDVRRAALINVGFLNIKTPETLLENMKVISLLSESYNPHVRYGAAMALGIACAGTSLIGAYNILQPLYDDSNYLVRQGAILATSMIFNQTNITQEPKLSVFKEKLEKVISDKDEHVLVKFGGLISYGLTEVGGRNGIIKLVSNSGNNRISSIVGLALFTQYYYWFPMIHFINLAVTPCMVHALDSNLKVVKNFKIHTKAKQSIYGYPKEIKAEEKSIEKKVSTAILSTHNRVKAKGKRTGTITSIMEQMDVDKPKTIEDKKEDEKKEEEKKEEEKKEDEPSEYYSENPFRIIPRQIPFVSYSGNTDYQAILNKRYRGFLMLKKINPNVEPIYFEEVKLVQQPITQTENTQNKYEPVPTQDVEMPEEFELK